MKKGQNIQNDQKEKKPRGRKLKNEVKRKRSAKGAPEGERPITVEVETVEPIWVDDDFKLMATSIFPRMYRAPFGGDGGRYYFREGFKDFYSGYSLWTHSVLPTNPGLIKWKVQNGEHGELISLLAREYGSIFHLHVARHERPDDEFRFKFNGPQSLNWRDYIWQTINHLGVGRQYGEQWEQWLRNDFMAYFRWKRFHLVNVLAVEVPLFDDKFKIATPGDMVIQCHIKKSPYAKEATEPAIVGVDFKTGESGVDFDEYKLQLEFMRHAWNQRFAGTKYEMTHVFNWHPKHRKLSPAGFNFVDQGGKFTLAQFKHLARTNAVMKYNRPGGKVLVYRDGENEFDTELEVVTPYQWLKEFFKK